MTVLPDLIARDLAVVFCGMAAGNTSAKLKAYYARRGNMFWQALFDVGLTPRLLAAEEYRTLKRYGLGLTDLAKSVSGMDDALVESHLDRERFLRLVAKYRPKIAAFTGKRPAEELLGRPVDYGLLPDIMNGTSSSSSPRHPELRNAGGASSLGENCRD